jgi:hypothetical protein
MTVSYADYHLHNGYIDHWLIAGPQAIPVTDYEQLSGEDFRFQIARRFKTADTLIAQPPVETETFTIDGTELSWDYIHCKEDHLVDLTAFYHTCHFLRAWAFAEIVSDAPRQVNCVLTTNGPADVWVNGVHAHRQEHFDRQHPQSVSFKLALKKGKNPLLVRFEEVATRDCTYVMAMQIAGLSPKDGQALELALPTVNPALDHRKSLEKMFDAAYLDRDVYVWDDEIIVRVPPEIKMPHNDAFRLQSPSGRIYAEKAREGQGNREIPLGQPMVIPEGRFQAVLMPHPNEYYMTKLQIQRSIGLTAVKNRYASTPYGTYAERRIEALQDAGRRDGDVFAEIAKMELGVWADVDPKVILDAIKGINQRKDCSDFYLVGLLGMLYRYGKAESFPAELKQPLEDCILNFKYWMDEPGSDAMCYWSENHQILFHACEILAGQLYPDRKFSNTGQTGQWHREKGERMAMSWLRKRGAGGFREWDSNTYFEEDLLALSHLADLAETSQVYELASVVMDKMFFIMAVNSYRGVFGSTHGRTYTPHIKGARLECTAGIGRLLWGMGVFNEHIRAVVSLACAKGYELPQIIADIAAGAPEEMWNRERHAGVKEQWCDLEEGPWEVNKVTYKTPDYMLASAQDYHPGEPGYQQHIWQATLSPDAVVFVTHPPCASEESSHRPNFWHGNLVLPRVAQWKDVLIAIHQLPANDWMGFTHAYFPTYAFDKSELREGWAFGQKGEGYIAITAARGIELINRGDNAYRELRSQGRQNVWVCHMGRAAVDGTYNQFIDNVLALKPNFKDLGVSLTTLRGDTMAFGWQGPLLLNGKEQPLDGFKHLQNPYCVVENPASKMDIQLGADVLRLNFE